MKKFNKFSKWIYLAVSVFITGALVVGTEVVRSYDSIIAGALNAANILIFKELSFLMVLNQLVIMHSMDIIT